MNSLLKKLSSLLAVILIAFSAGVFLPGCETDTGNGDAYEEMEETGEELGEGIEEGAEETGDTFEDMTD